MKLDGPLCPTCRRDAGIKILEWLAFDEQDHPVSALVECLDCKAVWVDQPVREVVK